MLRLLDFQDVRTRRFRLTGEQIVEAANLYERDWSLQRLGERYGCAHATARSAFQRTGEQLRRRPGWTPAGYDEVSDGTAAELSDGGAIVWPAPG